MKFYVLSDVHGFYTETVEALEEKGYFTDEEPHKLIICGDILDRGEEAVKMQEFILEERKKGNLILIKGNHEDLMEEFVDNLEIWMTPNLLYTHHWSNGTVETVLQLTGMSLNEIYTVPKAGRLRMQNSPLFKKIIPSMLNYYETKNYIFVHGWIPCTAYGLRYPEQFLYQPDWRNARKEEWEAARWYNGMLAASQLASEPNKTTVCGHWHCSFGHAVLEGKGTERGAGADFSPYYGEGIIAIDASTANSGKVNCIVLEDEEI
jgi:serine/threonine protein phosphatase 1